MIERLRTRIAAGEREGGFTLIELLVVIIIIGILLAIAVPSYLGFRDRANDAAAKANVRAALPAIEAHYGDLGTYTGATIVGLKASYDAGLKLTTLTVTATTYCAHSNVGNKDWKVNGPGGDPVAGTC